MMKKQLIMMSFAACVVGSAFAHEFRAPLVTERGPLRYDLALKRDKWSVETWSAFHSRIANRSFLEHGTDSKTVPAVIFGKETFTIGESFEQNDVVLRTGFFENQNPFFFLSKFTPSTQYTDRGMTIGARFEYPILENKGRLGIRAALPFRTVRMERNDDGDCPVNGVNDAVIRNDQARVVDVSGTAKIFGNINRYKLSLINQLRSIVPGGQIRPALLLRAGTPAAQDPSGFFNTQYQLPDGANTTPANNGITNTQGGSVTQGYTGENIPMVIIRGNGTNAQFPPAFTVPSAVTVSRANGVGSTPSNVAGEFIAKGTNSRVVFGPNNLVGPAANGATPATTDLLALEADLSNVTVANQSKGFAFVQDRDYTAIESQPAFDNLWITPVFDGDTQQMTQEALSTVNFIEQALQRYQTGSECGLAQLGFEFATYERTGLGDLDVDLFYEHTFSDYWRAEVWFGIRFPTGGSNKFCGNPYRIETGNGNHFELKLGALAAWQTPLNWLALKTDLQYAWVLEADEQRAAAFRCATVTNVGPCTCAEVDWGYLTGHFDFNFYHPKSRKLGTMIGYEIYYKSEDNVCFKRRTVTNHFLGRVWANADGVPASETVAGTQFVDYPMQLSRKVAERNTERIAHRVRMETHWHAHRYWSFFAGGAYTFAGKNIFRESDVHGGIAIRY